MEIRTRRHLFGILGIAAILVFPGAANATGTPAEAHKEWPSLFALFEPAAPAITEAIPAHKKVVKLKPKHLIDLTALPRRSPAHPEVAANDDTRLNTLPRRRPGQETVVMSLSPAAKAEEATRAQKTLTDLAKAETAQVQPVVAAQPVVQAPAPQTVAAPVVAAAAAPAPAPAVVLKPPSLIDRMLGGFGSGMLSDANAARYAHIFAFQDTSDFEKANAEIAKLTDDRLMGHVLSQRYLNPAYTPSYQELADWMHAYADQPDAQKIYDIAKKRKPKKGGPTLAMPHTARGIYALYDFDVGQLATPYMGERRHTPRQRDAMRAVDDAVSENPTLALKRLDKQGKLFEDTEYDSLRADIAASYFYNAKVDKARELSEASAQRSGHDVPLADWIAGLSAWRQGDYANAAKYFELTANSSRTSAWMAAAGSHWAARSYLRSHQPQKVSYWLRRAAEYPRTFYGLISMKALGMDQAKFNWNVPALTDAHIKALSGVPAGRRALALVDAERPVLAEQELRQVNPGDDALLQEAMIALANRSGMPGLALRMGSSFKGRDGRLYDAALYPDAPWEPNHGFSVDKALVYAFIRQESQFQPYANNRDSGALGLMQLMPDTAKHVARLYGDDISHEHLSDPMVNIDLGQKYLNTLLKNDYVENNLFKLAVAYNAGPGKLARWEDNAREADDPLLFIESIPVAETRIFVERVLTNYWIYRIKFHQDTASLDKVAEGDWPVYTAQDNTTRGAIYAAAGNLFSR